VEEDGMGNLPERSSQCSKESRWHNETVSIHGKIMVDTVKNEMQTYSHSVIRQVTSGISI
jgi:hypothetical protein